MADIDKTVVMDQQDTSSGKELCPVCGMELQPDPQHPDTLYCFACNFRKKLEVILAPGYVVGNKYRLLSHLNSGGCGDLFLCCPLDDLSQRYVLKVMKNCDFVSHARFQREGNILSSIRNPRIAAVLDFWDADNLSYIIMEYIKGHNLKELMDIYDINEETALQIILETTLALQYIWDNYTIIHRDIKPENIMLNEELQVKLLDFGLSKIIGSGRSRDVTTEKVGIGTPGYMSPEQFLDSKNVDFKADIYSLGATLFFLITGEKPIAGKSHSEVYASTVQNSPPSPDKFCQKCSPVTIDLIRSMMQLKPEDRPDYNEVIQRISALLNQ